MRTCKILVATSCAGTGLDLETVTEVLVVGLPYSIEQLIQWAGRCRGDGNITVIVPRAHATMSKTELSGKNRITLVYHGDNWWICLKIDMSRSTASCLTC